MFPDDADVQAVQEAMFDPFEYLVLREARRPAARPTSSAPLGKVSYHIPCHSRVQNIGQKTREVLEWMPGTDGQHGRALLRPRRHLGREDASSSPTSMKIGRPVFKADGRRPSPTTSAPTARSPATTSSRASRRRAAAARRARRIRSRCCASPTGSIEPHDACRHHPRQPDDARGLREGAQGSSAPRSSRTSKLRTVQLGEHVTLQFEDELTIRYQIQEMLRIEKIFEEEGIQDELDAYTRWCPTAATGRRRC